MLKNIIFVLTFLFAFIFLHIQCKPTAEIQIPAKTSRLNDAAYNMYKEKLQKAIIDKDNFEIGMQLCNLGADKKLVYHHIRKGLSENKANCDRALHLHTIYVEDNMAMWIVELDTVEWVKACNICLNDKKAVEKFRNQREQDYLKAQKDRDVLNATIDVTKLDSALMRTLQVINDDDVRYRGSTYSKDWRLQNVLDSINLKKVEAIMLQRPYPSYKEVGIDLHLTIWLVLHHQTDKAIREKHLPYLEAAVKSDVLQKWTLETFNRRTKYEL